MPRWCSVALLVSLIITGCSETGLSADLDGPGTDGGTADRLERCNGEDDDGDGGVDEGFPDTDGDGVADCVDDDCDLELASAGPVDVDADCLTAGPAVTDPWDVRIEWQWTGLLKDSAVSNVIMTPVVGNLTDTNGDGDIDLRDTPDVAFVAFDGFGSGNGTLVVVSGGAGRERWTSAGWTLRGGIALADIDGDGLSDVVGFGASRRPRAVSHDGRNLWTSAASVNTLYPQATVADLDGDGQPEVIADNLILDGATGRVEESLATTRSILHRLPAVGDLDLDGRQEIILGNTVYGSDGQVRWMSPDTGTDGHWSAIVDADGDPQGEVAMIGGGFFTIYDQDGSELTRVSTGGAQPGPPCAADFDGDGDVEIAWGSSSAIAVYELDGTRSWSTPVDDTSGLAACSAYDADGDGAFELFFGGQGTFYILDGTDGTVLFSDGGHASGTLHEYPSITDVDQDGSAEIIIASNNVTFPGWAGITVFGHADGGWMRSGTTWHIHDFAVTNVLPDGTVPAEPEPWWQSHNLYRARPAVGMAAADLQVRITDVCFSGCEQDSVVEVAVQVSNAGVRSIEAGVPLSLYRNDGGTLTRIDTGVLTEPVPAGTAVSATDFVFGRGSWGSDGIVVRVDDDGTGAGLHLECDERNNEERYSDSPCP